MPESVLAEALVAVSWTAAAASSDRAMFPAPPRSCRLTAVTPVANCSPLLLVTVTEVAVEMALALPSLMAPAPTVTLPVKLLLPFERVQTPVPTFLMVVKTVLVAPPLRIDPAQVEVLPTAPIS